MRGEPRARRLGGVHLPTDRGHGRGVGGVGGDVNHGKPGQRRDDRAEPAGDALAPDRRPVDNVDARVPGRLHDAHGGSLGILEVRLEVTGHRRARGRVILDVFHDPIDAVVCPFRASRRVVAVRLDPRPRRAPRAVHRGDGDFADALVPPPVSNRPGLHHHQNPGAGSRGVQRVHSLALVTRAVQGHVAHHAPHRLGRVRSRQRHVAALRGGSHLELVEVVLRHRSAVDARFAAPE